MNLPLFRPGATNTQHAGPSPVDVRPDLQPVLAEHWSQRAARLTFAVSVLVVVAALFGLAAFHAMIVTQQRAVDTANAELAEVEALHEQLRVQVTQAEAPERILAVAQNDLGMISVEPSEVTYRSAPQHALDPASARALLDQLPIVTPPEDSGAAE